MAEEKQEQEKKDIRAGATSAKCCSLSLFSSVDGWLEKELPLLGRRGRELNFSYRAEAFLL